MPLSRILLFSFTFSVVEGASFEAFGRQLRTEARSDTIILPRPQHTLRLCNAWPNQAKVSAKVVRTGSAVEDLPYKSCRDSRVDLEAGDQLNFVASETNHTHAPVGSFSIGSLPDTASTLLLVVGGGRQSGVTFSSHTYTKGAKAAAQLVCLDTFQGATHRRLRLREPPQPKSDATSGDVVLLSKTPADLTFGSVQAVLPGSYSLTLEDLNDRTLSSTELLARADRQYVVLRVGDASSGGAFPEEVIAFPQVSSALSRVALLVWSCVLLGA